MVAPTDSTTFLVLKAGQQKRVVGKTLRLWLGDSLVSAWLPQTIRGEKTFADLARFNAGLETNGMTSTGSATKAAIVMNGVQSVGDTIVSSDFWLDGRVSGVLVNCPTKHNYVYLPTVATTKKWTYSIGKRDTTAFWVIVVFPDGSTFTIYYKKTLTFFNNGSTWERK